MTLSVFFADERLLDNHRLNISTSLSNLIQGLHIAVDSKCLLFFIKNVLYGQMHMTQKDTYMEMYIFESWVAGLLLVDFSFGLCSFFLKKI